MSDTHDQIDLLNELQWRGLLKDCTDLDGLRAHLADPENAPRKIYAGFDPTADSLTIGNLVPIMLLAHVKRAGHTPIVVMGGGTGLIGDPSGKSAERQLNTVETIEHFIDCQRPIYSAVLDQVNGPQHHILNNHTWLKDISYIEALRDIGKHFSVNMMMQKESVRARLNEREQGISYTEFSYMILQAYDFAHLYEKEGVTVQFGGSDQYGNIVAGGDLIRRQRVTKFVQLAKWICDKTYSGIDKTSIFWPDRIQMQSTIESMLQSTKPESDLFALLNETVEKSVPDLNVTAVLNKKDDPAYSGLQDYLSALNIEAYQKECFGLTNHLIQKTDGTKFGKTESGAIWLTAKRTSPYAYYQFWLNATDEDALNWIKIFTFLDKPTINELIARHDENPGKRELQRTLAQHATTILHGDAAMHNSESAGKALFSGDIATLDEQTMLEVFASVPTTEHKKADLADGLDLVETLKSTNLATSNREAREFLNEGSVSINGEKINAETKVTESNLLHNTFLAIRRGKKKWHLTKWS